jgi:XRE family transcriptional regulator, aerobic/anaerobic benzoate catabolism transcriptional regulator
MSASASESRRGDGPDDEAYLKLVGGRVRLERVRRNMSRKLLSQASGVSERYLAELERGTGNASLLVVRQIAIAMGLGIADLTSERAAASAAPGHLEWPPPRRELP